MTGPILRREKCDAVFDERNKGRKIQLKDAADTSRRDIPAPARVVAMPGKAALNTGSFASGESPH